MRDREMKMPTRAAVLQTVTSKGIQPEFLLDDAPDGGLDLPVFVE